MRLDLHGAGRDVTLVDGRDGCAILDTDFGAIARSLRRSACTFGLLSGPLRWNTRRQHYFMKRQGTGNGVGIV
jgi:hypothetical protein